MDTSETNEIRILRDALYGLRNDKFELEQQLAEAERLIEFIVSHLTAENERLRTAISQASRLCTFTPGAHGIKDVLEQTLEESK